MKEVYVLTGYYAHENGMIFMKPPEVFTSKKDAIKKMQTAVDALVESKRSASRLINYNKRDYDGLCMYEREVIYNDVQFGSITNLEYKFKITEYWEIRRRDI